MSTVAQPAPAKMSTVTSQPQAMQMKTMTPSQVESQEPAHGHHHAKRIRGGGAGKAAPARCAAKRARSLPDDNNIFIFGIRRPRGSLVECTFIEQTPVSSSIFWGL
ncbi:hypothetical protein H0H93_002656 [Arthromyces matolae]|nr:hypothetical protein H0H93_002656 [Arthromyces matolae]